MVKIRLKYVKMGVWKEKGAVVRPMNAWQIGLGK